MGYESEAHAVQSGLKMQANYDRKIADPLDIRVGVCMAFCDSAALAELLLAKGVFTMDEYRAALEQSVARERRRLEKELTEHFGRPVTLG